MSLLDVRNLSIRYAGGEVVSKLSFSVDTGESVGLVGESGSGKTQTALAIMGLLPGAAAVSGSIAFGGTEIVGASERQLDRLRAERIGMVFQDPMQALNPYVPIGKQLRRVLLRHGTNDGREADQRVMHMLSRVGLPDPARQFRAYAHQLSGGMRQRVMIASALIADPELLIADEPTTALDVTVQAQILDLLERIREETALLLITHDLGIIAGHCERLLVIENGRLVESGPTRKLFSEPQSPHTCKLIEAAPRLDGSTLPPLESGDVVLEANDVSVSFEERDVRQPLHAVQDLDLQLRAGETVAVVGESGSGKSSFVRAVLGLVPMRAGRVTFCGQEIAGPVQHEDALLLFALDRHEAHVRPRHRLADRLGIGCVILLTFHIGLYVRGRNEPHVMAERCDRPRPEVRGRAGFHADQARFKLSEEIEQRGPPQLLL